MNLQQAKQALEQGLRIRHRYFSKDEWYERVGDSHKFINEEGYSINNIEFNETYNKPGFEEGWSIVPRTVVEEDEMNGHPYPGHETWNDDYDKATAVYHQIKVCYNYKLGKA